MVLAGCVMIATSRSAGVEGGRKEIRSFEESDFAGRGILNVASKDQAPMPTSGSLDHLDTFPLSGLVRRLRTLWRSRGQFGEHGFSGASPLDLSSTNIHSEQRYSGVGIRSTVMCVLVVYSLSMGFVELNGFVSGGDLLNIQRCSGRGSAHKKPRRQDNNLGGK